MKRELTFSQGPRLKKSLGQNFLKDAGIARRIVAALDITPNDYVLEIGPGAGALTGLICAEERPAGLALVEKDAHWAFAQGKACAQIGINHLVINTDALDFAWERLAARGKIWKIIGNLPYNVASPLLWNMVSQARGFERAVVMVQREVAQRITAPPGGKTYGALSVWMQSFIASRKVMDVPPAAFYPAPKVWSQVLELRPLADRFNGDKTALDKILKICFQKRRKQLGTILGSYLNADANNWLESQNLSLTARPEELSPHAFQALSSLLFQPKGVDKETRI